MPGKFVNPPLCMYVSRHVSCEFGSYIPLREKGSFPKVVQYSNVRGMLSVESIVLDNVFSTH